MSPHPSLRLCSNMDLVAYVRRMPRSGETIHGSSFHQGFGGKGANQAAQAAKLGSKTVFCGGVGRDTFGSQMLENFEALGIDTKHILVSEDVSSGVAPILVDESGANSIVIVGGANDQVTPAHIATANTALCSSRVMVTQLEIPTQSTAYALQMCGRSVGGQGPVRLLNPAPAPEVKWDSKDRGTAILRAAFNAADILAPNETELENLTGCTVDASNIASVVRAVERLFERVQPRCVVVTLGVHGALAATVHAGTLKWRHVAAVKGVQAKDTSGAGDSFLGALAHVLAASRGKTGTLAQAAFGQERVQLPELALAMEAAAVVAAQSVQREGTQQSYSDGEDPAVASAIKKALGASSK